MPFLYDNLISSVTSGVVVLILISIQMRATDMNVAETARNRAVSQAESFATWLEEDLESAGRNRDSTETVFEYGGWSETSQSPTDSTVESLTFYYRTSENAPVTRINYSVAGDTRTINGEKRTVYTLDRRVERNGKVTGRGSAGMLGYFDCRFIGKNGRPTTNRDSVHAIRVRFSILTPFWNNESTLREVHRMVVVSYAPVQN